MRARTTTGVLVAAAALALTGCTSEEEPPQAPETVAETTAEPSPTPTSTLPADAPGEEWSASLDAPSPATHLKVDAVWQDPFFADRSPWTSEANGAQVWSFYERSETPQVAAVAVISPGEEQCSVVGSSPEDVMNQLGFDSAYSDLVSTSTGMTNNPNQLQEFDGAPRQLQGGDVPVGADEGTLMAVSLNELEDPMGLGKAATGYASVAQEEEGRFSTNACALVLTDRTAEYEGFGETVWADAVNGAREAGMTVTMTR